MENSQNKKSTNPIHDPAVMGIVMLVIVSVLWKNWNQIVYAYITHCDVLFFLGWILILALIRVKLKKSLDESKKDRKSLLRMKQIRSESLPVQTKNKITEIKVGYRLNDGRAVHLSDQTRLQQVQATGATGRGKSESVILPWMVQDYRVKNNSVILIDGKGDPEIVSRFREYTETDSNQNNILVFNPMDKNSCVINPLKWGTPQQITDRIMTSFEFNDPYYKSIQSDALLTVVTLILDVEKEVTFQKITRSLRDMDYLSKLLTQSKAKHLAVPVRQIQTMKEETRIGNFSGLLSQLSPFVNGEIARLVNGMNPVMLGDEGAVGVRSEISLAQIMTAKRGGSPKAALILLPTLIYQEVGKVIGRMLLQEIASSVGYRSSRDKIDNEFTSVFLDEFSSFAYLGFEQILNKARSSGVALHLSHQSTGDLEIVSPEFARIINTNTNVKCLLGLNDPDTADFFARHIGTETIQKFTEKMEEKQYLFSTQDEQTGVKPMRDAESYKIHPNRLKNLMHGEGVIHVPMIGDSLTEEIQFYDLSALNLAPTKKWEAA